MIFYNIIYKLICSADSTRHDESKLTIACGQVILTRKTGERFRRRKYLDIYRRKILNVCLRIKNVSVHKKRPRVEVNKTLLLEASTWKIFPVVQRNQSNAIEV